MLWCSERKRSLERTSFLVERTRINALPNQRESLNNSLEQSAKVGHPLVRLKLSLEQGEVPLSPLLFLLLVLSGALALGGMSAYLVPGYFVPLFVLAGGWFPFSWLEGRIQKHAANFADDYAATLLATASSLKAGMTPYIALERAVRLLPSESPVRAEVELLLERLRQGKSKEESVCAFGQGIRQEDLSLFRSSFLLVLENGGRFAPTLLRLASVSRDRIALIRSARVSTANMRMTANVLVTLAPVILLATSFRTADFWELLLHNPTANFLGTVGTLIIFISYILLRKMSSFKP